MSPVCRFGLRSPRRSTRGSIALEAQVTAAEDVSAIKRLQRTYGYYLDKGMWADLAEYYTDDAVTNYPAGVYIGKESIRKHLFMNVGGGQMGDIGLPDGRLYNHMNIQPVIHLDPGGRLRKAGGARSRISAVSAAAQPGPKASMR